MERLENLQQSTELLQTEVTSLKEKLEQKGKPQECIIWM